MSDGLTGLSYNVVNIAKIVAIFYRICGTVKVDGNMIRKMFVMMGFVHKLCHVNWKYLGEQINNYQQNDETYTQSHVQTY